MKLSAEEVAILILTYVLKFWFFCYWFHNHGFKFCHKSAKIALIRPPPQKGKEPNERSMKNVQEVEDLEDGQSCIGCRISRRIWWSWRSGRQKWFGLAPPKRRPRPCNVFSTKGKKKETFKLHSLHIKRYFIYKI